MYVKLLLICLIVVIYYIYITLSLQDINRFLTGSAISITLRQGFTY